VVEFSGLAQSGHGGGKGVEIGLAVLAGDAEVADHEFADPPLGGADAQGQLQDHAPFREIEQGAGDGLAGGGDGVKAEVNAAAVVHGLGQDAGDVLGQDGGSGQSTAILPGHQAPQGIDDDNGGHQSSRDQDEAALGLESAGADKGLGDPMQQGVRGLACEHVDHLLSRLG
jgi:hypothetical protein